MSAPWSGARAQQRGPTVLRSTLLNEHFRIKGRKKLYESVETIQKNLDDCLIQYNAKRPHQCRNINCRTSETVFKEGLKKNKNRGKEKKTATITTLQPTQQEPLSSQYRPFTHISCFGNFLITGK